ncbi:hypothetical protein JCM10207_001270 [Rhodosporidiobolus poonsookiae]
MGSSSDIEILDVKPASPLKPRRGGRTRKAPPSIDDTPSALSHAKRARLSVLSDTEEETTAVQPTTARAVVDPTPSRSPPLPVGSTSKLPAVDHLPALAGSSATTATLIASSSEPNLASHRSSPAPAPASSTLPRAASTSTALNALPASTSSSKATKRPRSRTPGDGPPRKFASAAPSSSKPAGGNSSDEADDFFGRAKPVAKGRVPKAAVGRVPGGRKPTVKAKVVEKPPTASPAKGKRRPVVEFSTDSEVDKPSPRKKGASSSTGGDSDSDSNSGSGSASDSSAKSVSKGKGRKSDGGVKHVHLPEWARKGSGGAGSHFARAGMSGADRAAKERGYGKNRARKRLSDSEDEGEGEGGLKAAVAAAGKANGKGKGKEKAEEDDPFGFHEEENDDTDDSLELALSAKTPRRAGAKKPVAGDSSSELDVQETPKANRSPKRPRPTASPSRPTTRKGAVLTLSSDSSDPASPPRPVEDDAPATLEQIRATFRRLQSPGPNAAAGGSELARSRAGTQSATASPAKSTGGGGARGALSSSSPAPEVQANPVTIRLKMVFDPTKNVPEIAKRAYEREETFELDATDSFSTVFYTLSLRRSIPRDNLVLTYTSPLTSRRTQVFEFGTPRSLGIFPGATAEMKGYTKEVWEKTVALPGAGGAGGQAQEDEDAELERAAAAAAARARSPSAASKEPTPLPGALASDAGLGGGASSSPSKGGAPPGTLPLTVRISKTQAFDVAPQLSMTMAQLLKWCARKAGIKDAARLGKMWLEFEGDKVDGASTVEEMRDEFDLEGEETFELKEGQ